MISRRIVDTNLIVRHLVQDHEEHARKAAHLFSACDEGRLILVVLPTVLAECIFVLESFYDHSRVDVADALEALIHCSGIECRDYHACLEALQIYSRTNLHFVDCLVAAEAVKQDIPIATFDKGIAKVKRVKVKVDLDDG